MRGINKVILIGNVGADPEQRQLSGGGVVVNIALATTASWKDKKTGQHHEQTEWHRIVFFNPLAQVVSGYVQKGSKLYIEGALRTKSWEQGGLTRYATEIVGSEMQMLDPGVDGKSVPFQSCDKTTLHKKQHQDPEIDNDDLPF